MKRLVEQKQQQSTVKLVPTSNGSKLGQLRADMAKETAGTKRTARAMKPVIKAPKMMLTTRSGPLHPLDQSLATRCTD